MYNLAKQALAKKLLGGSGVITCLAVHPSGDHVLVGGGLLHSCCSCCWGGGVGDEGRHCLPGSAPSGGQVPVGVGLLPVLLPLVLAGAAWSGGCEFGGSSCPVDGGPSRLQGTQDRSSVVG